MQTVAVKRRRAERAEKKDGRGKRIIELGLRVRLLPQEATEIILQAFRDSGANLRAAAANLGVTERTLHRYVDTLKIDWRIAEIRDRARREGWLKTARWPDKAGA